MENISQQFTNYSFSQSEITDLGNIKILSFLKKDIENKIPNYNDEYENCLVDDLILNIDSSSDQLTPNNIREISLSLTDYNKYTNLKIDHKKFLYQFLQKKNMKKILNKIVQTMIMSYDYYLRQSIDLFSETFLAFKTITQLYGDPKELYRLNRNKMFEIFGVNSEYLKQIIYQEIEKATIEYNKKLKEAQDEIKKNLQKMHL